LSKTGDPLYTNGRNVPEAMPAKMSACGPSHICANNPTDECGFVGLQVGKLGIRRALRENAGPQADKKVADAGL
jgi:hypothetical protein